jgi:leader peptidase (prepilin peptidase)/N-methyltransferase
MFLMSLLIKGAFGGGDIKLMAASGLYLGWRLTLAGAFLGLFISGFYAIYLLLLRKAGSKSKIKLVPFLSIGLSAASLFGDVLLLFIFM